MAVGLWLVLGCVTGGVSGGIAAAEVAEEVSRARSVVRSFDDRGSVRPEGYLHYWARNGFSACTGVARRLLRNRGFSRGIEQAVAVLRQSGVGASAIGVSSCLVGLCLALVVVLMAITGSVAVCVFVPLALLGLGRVMIARELDRRERTLREQIPDALRCMESCLHAGLSIPQAFKETALDSPKPVKGVFEQVTHDLEMGFSVERSLRRLYDQAGFTELAFVAMALDVVYVCGGSAAPVLRSAQESVSRGIELKRSLAVQTAQARLSARIVALMPILLMAALSLISPGFLSPFFQSGGGFALFCVAVGMEVLGVLAVRKTLALN